MTLPLYLDPYYSLTDAQRMFYGLLIEMQSVKERMNTTLNELNEAIAAAAARHQEHMVFSAAVTGVFIGMAAALIFAVCWRLR
jgi:hypothetical protein